MAEDNWVDVFWETIVPLQGYRNWLACISCSGVRVTSQAGWEVACSDHSYGECGWAWGWDKKPGGAHTGLGQGWCWGRLGLGGAGLSCLPVGSSPIFLMCCTYLVSSSMQEEVSIPNQKSRHCRVTMSSVIALFREHPSSFTLNISIIVLISFLFQQWFSLSLFLGVLDLSAIPQIVCPG